MKMSTKKRAIDKMFKRRDRFQIPSWQRGQVWPKAKQQHLVDTILRGWKLPKFTFIKSDNPAIEFEIADGQQRLNAIFDFMSGSLDLSESTSARHGGAVKYADLDLLVSDAFDDFEIDYDEIEDETDTEIKDYFTRLQAGMTLNASERLNAVDSNLRDFCLALTKHKFFTETVVFKDTRYAFFEVIAKAAAIEVEGFGAGLRINDLSETFGAQAGFSKTSAVAKRLTSALDYLHRALPAAATITKNRSTTQSLVNLACRIVDHKPSPSSHSSFGGFASEFETELSKQVELGQVATDVQLISYQRTVNANVKTGPLTRHRILLKKLFMFDPAFSGDFSTTEIAGLDLKTAIKEEAKNVREGIVELNELFSAKTGNDLFKITTSIIKALNISANQCFDENDYSDLMSKLYFIFKEGIGKKISSLPKSFQDIDVMRVGMQHDLDHEGPSKAAKKKVALSATFLNYLGVAAPASASSEQFGIAQLKLLSSLKVDLYNLRAGAAAGKL